MSLDIHGRRIIFVEFTDYAGEWRPFRVVTQGVSGGLVDIDVEWCMRDSELFCHESGYSGDDGWVHVHRLSPGHRSRLWIAEGYKLYNGGSAGHVEIDPNAFGYDMVTEIPDDILREASEGSTYYCTICDDFLPGDFMCNHVWWCETLGWYAGPGYDDGEQGCEADDCPCSENSEEMP